MKEALGLVTPAPVMEARMLLPPDEGADMKLALTLLVCGAGDAEMLARTPVAESPPLRSFASMSCALNSDILSCTTLHWQLPAVRAARPSDVYFWGRRGVYRAILQYCRIAQ